MRNYLKDTRARKPSGCHILPALAVTLSRASSCPRKRGVRDLGNWQSGSSGMAVDKQQAGSQSHHRGTELCTAWSAPFPGHHCPMVTALPRIVPFPPQPLLCELQPGPHILPGPSSQSISSHCVDQPWCPLWTVDLLLLRDVTGHLVVDRRILIEAAGLASCRWVSVCSVKGIYFPSWCYFKGGRKTKANS